MDKLESLVKSWDFAGAIAIALAIFIWAPQWVSAAMMLPFYEIGISVLSITFAVYFAALATIITSGDDDFVRFVQDADAYDGIIWAFQATLGLLFAALLLSLGAFAVTSVQVHGDADAQQHVVLTILFALFFFWSLFATVASANDAIRWARHRSEFLSKRRTPPKSDAQ